MVNVAGFRWVWSLDTDNRLTVRLTNRESIRYREVRVHINATDPFTSESPTAYVEELAPGESATLFFEVTVSEDAVPTTTAIEATVDDAQRRALTEGVWDTTALMYQNLPETRKVANELPYIDAMDVFETRFNTSGDTLTAVYEELIGSGLTELDPFVDSEEAVDAWEEGDFESLVRHNVADIRRTRALMRLAERYCSKSHFTMRSLDPVT